MQLFYRQLKEFEHIMIITYEQLSADLVGSIKRISKVLNCNYNDDQLERLAAYVSFKKMQTQASRRMPKFFQNNFK